MNAKTLGAEPAHPTTATDGWYSPGLTKLEAFTMAAMQGLATTDTRLREYKELAATAVMMALATLEELSKRGGE